MQAVVGGLRRSVRRGRSFRRLVDWFAAAARGLHCGAVIVSERLDLVPMSGTFLAWSAAGRWDDAASELGAAVPEDWHASRGLAQMWWERHQADPAFVSWGPRALILRSEGRMAGHAGFHFPPGHASLESTAPGGVELGYTVFASDRGQGLATEAGRALLAWAAGQGAASCVVSISPDNAPSLAVARKLGFVTKVGHHIDPEDGPEDVYLMES